MIKINPAIAFSLLFFLGSCDKDADCQEMQSLPLTSLEEAYGCNDTRYGLNVDLSDNHTIIRSQSEFENLVSSNSCTPQIDFSKYDLLIGKKRLPSGNSSVDYDLSRVCPGNKKRLRVTFNQNISAEAPNVTYHALIPKLQNKESLEVDIELKQ